MARLALALGVFGALSLTLVDAGCSTRSAGGVAADDSGGTVAADACALGATCSAMQSCPGGIASCTSNCQCLGGTWQAPCLADLPTTGTTCSSQGAECGYVTSTNACGAANCYCQGGAWSCGPTCAIPPTDASDAVEDAGACGAAGGQCVFGGCSNPGPQSCGTAGTFCCLNSIPDASTDGADACSPSGCTGSCLRGRERRSRPVTVDPCAA